MSVNKNLDHVIHRVKTACEKVQRDPKEITIIGVTKYVTIERAKELIQAGIHHIGENRTDEFLTKYDSIGDDVSWHFIGTLQSRKTKDIIDQVDAIHSLDRLSLAKQIHRRANRQIDCFVQVNVSGETTKHGIKPEEVIPFVKTLAPYTNVRVVGLMTMAPHTDDENEIRHVFRRLAQLRDDVKELSLPHAPCENLSMGMSNDYEIAIEEGATHIRLGSTLVGVD